MLWYFVHFPSSYELVFLATHKNDQQSWLIVDLLLLYGWN